MKFIRLVLITILLSINNTFAKEIQITPYSIYAGGNINYNLYISNFKELPGYISYCPNFNLATGLGFSTNIGLNYRFDQLVFNLFESLDLRVAYDNISANYKITDKFANIIKENEKYDGISEHRLEPKIQMFSFSPGIKLNLSKFIPINAKIGLFFAFTTNNGFYQTERIIAPDFINDINTGTKTRYEYFSDTIPGFNNFLYGLNIGFNFNNIKLANNFFLSPLININYSFNDLAKNLDWKYFGLQCGINLIYQIPKPEYIPPKPAPLPDLPKPIKPEMISSKIITFINDNELFNDTVLIEIKEKRFITTNFLFPIIFYKLNSTDPLHLTYENMREEEKIQSQALETILKYLQKLNSIKLDVSYLETEHPDTIDTRINKLLSLNANKGIPTNQIQINKIPQKTNDELKQELLEDKSYIKFNIDSESQMLNYLSDTVSQRFISPQLISFKIIVNHNQNYLINTEIFIDDSLFTKFNSTSFDINIDNNYFEKLINLQTSKITIKSKIKDIFHQSSILNKEIFIQPMLTIDKVYENIINDYSQDQYVQQFILGYFEFDKAEFISINQIALNSIKKGIMEGKFIEIIPLFDFLGTDEHNIQLAMERANATLKLLELNKDDVKITIPKTFFFSNNNPYGRMMNRSVIVRVKDIN